MPAYILRDIDPVLWDRVKSQADKDGVYLRETILALLELYAAGKVSVKATVKASRS